MRASFVVFVRENDCSGGCTDVFCMSVDGSSLVSGRFDTELLLVVQRRDASKVDICV